MKQLLFKTTDSWTAFVLRLTLGLVIFPHGAQKTFGWFGGPGFTKEMNMLQEHVHLPWIVAFLVILIEFIGSIGLIFGQATRIWSIAFIGLFIEIIFTAHIQHGFFMNWFGNQQGEGCEYHILVIGIAISLLFQGGGKYSLDTKI